MANVLLVWLYRTLFPLMLVATPVEIACSRKDAKALLCRCLGYCTPALLLHLLYYGLACYGSASARLLPVSHGVVIMVALSAPHRALAWFPHVRPVLHFAAPNQAIVTFLPRILLFPSGLLRSNVAALVGKFLCLFAAESPAGACS